MNGFRSLGKEKPQIPHPKIVRALENPSITINEPCRVWLLAMLYAILNLDWITIRQKMKTLLPCSSISWETWPGGRGYLMFQGFSEAHFVLKISFFVPY